MKRQRRCLALLAGVSIFAFSATAVAAGQSGAQVSGSPAAPDQASVATPSTDRSAQAPNVPGVVEPAAQDIAAQSPAETTASGADIVVTGSRLARSTFQTPTPVTAIGEAQLEAKAATTVTDLLRDIPALRPNRNNTSALDVGSSNFNARSLGATRTLVLIDGQRAMFSSPTSGFDLNLLPTSLIKRLEVVTGGASSVYGSDAIAGVVNVILDGQLKGFKADVQNNITSHGDAFTFTTNAAYGTDFAGDKGHIVIAGSYFTRPDILYQGRRDWGDDGVTLIPNPTYTATNGQFRQFVRPNVRYSNMTNGGVITTNGALKNIMFGDGGAQSLLQQGTNVSLVWMEGGNGVMPQPALGVLLAAGERVNGYGRATYDLTSGITAYVDVLGAHSKSRQTNNYNFNTADIVVRRDNAFLPANIRAAMIANNLQTINVGRINPELGINLNSTTNTYIRSSGGLKGKIGSWNWDVGGSYTTSKYRNQSLNNRNNANWTRALDSVISPTTGQAVCRSTLTDPTNGCQPANIFGINSVSAAAVGYAAGTSFIEAKQNQYNATLNLRGRVFDTWAGPVQVALGGEYRKNDLKQTTDPISAIGGWRQANSAPFAGKVDVKEAYIETSIPLAADSVIGKSLDVDLAGRFVDYSTSGSTAVWKVGVNWAINDQIRLRGAYSRDFRAPTLNELFSAATTRSQQAVIDRPSNAQVLVTTVSGGNRNLQPEVAHTFTTGVILRPSFVPNLQFSIDAFDIVLDDAINILGQQEVIDRCNLGDPSFCSALTRDANGTLTRVQSTYFNAQTLKTRGIDFELAYRVPVGAGDVSFSELATYVDRLVTTSGTTRVDTAGQLTGGNATPKWRSSTTLAYDQGPFTGRLLGTFIGGGHYDSTYGPLDLDKQHFKGRFYLDFTAEYRINEHFQLFVKVENMLDKAPPLIAENVTGRAGAATASSFYDLIGRNLGVGARVRF
jgi:iron complex outermembrane receptor protein